MGKKLLLVAIVFVALLLIGFMTKFDKNESDLDVVRVAEVTDSAFYTPFYVAIEKGYFEDNNIKIDLILTSGANNVTAAVISGDVHVGFCGPEATIYVYQNNEKDYIKSFAGLTKRDGQFIVGRNKIDDFKLEDLKGMEVLAGRVGGMPIVNFKTALANENISEIKVNDSVDFANLTSAFISGQGDAVNLFEPNATKVEKQGFGYVLGSVGKYAGEVPYTAFNAKKSFIAGNKDLINRFRDALNKGLEYTNQNISSVLAKDILSQFPDTSLNDLELIIERYKNADTWLMNVNINEKMFDNLVDMLINNKMIDERPLFSDLITND